MFQDQSLDSVDFPSCWKQEKSTTEVTTQTSETLTYEAEVQTTEKESISVQTDEEPEKPFRLVVDNSLELKEFLKRVGPMVCEQLKRNTESHAFDEYKVHWEEESTAVTCLNTLTEDSLNSEPRLQATPRFYLAAWRTASDGKLAGPGNKAMSCVHLQHFHCTGLAWNCTGSVLAVSYGRFDHQDWCSHKSLLCTWNLDRRSTNCSKADVSIDVPSCLMCVVFHPEQPAVVAGGTFSGEVRIWNTGVEGDPLLASSGFTDLGHKEPVAKLSWILDLEDRRRHRYLLLSLGNEGKVLIWECQPGQRELKLLKGFRLLTENVPRSLRVGRAKSGGQVGGTCLSFSLEDKSLFVAGSENGGIFKCSLEVPTATIVDGTTVETDFQSPVKFAFRPHHGPVYSVSCSPFHRNLFLSCGTDTTTRLYSLLDSTPILLVEPGCGYLFSVCWSPSRPLVFAVGTGDGHVLIYDLKRSHIKPRVCLDASPHQRAVFSVEYNHKRPRLLASGDANGVVKVWRLNTELTSQGSNEIEQLNTIALEPLSNASL